MVFSPNAPGDLWRAVKMLLLLLTTRSCAPQVATFPRPPVIVMPVVAVTVAAPTDATFRALLVVSAACLVAMVDIMSIPPRYRGPVIKALLLHTMLPLMSKDGALTGHVNTAVLDKPSRSTPPESARRSVWPVAGFTRAQVNSLSCSTDVEPNNACF